MMNVGHHQAADDAQIKATDLRCELASRLLSSTCVHLPFPFSITQLESYCLDCHPMKHKAEIMCVLCSKSILSIHPLVCGLLPVGA